MGLCMTPGGCRELSIDSGIFCVGAIMIPGGAAHFVEGVARVETTRVSGDTSAGSRSR
jgi:hypothetical protein